MILSGQIRKECEIDDGLGSGKASLKKRRKGVRVSWNEVGEEQVGVELKCTSQGEEPH